MKRVAAFEVQRHQQLLEILGVNEAAVTVGFNHVAQKLEETIEGVELEQRKQRLSDPGPMKGRVNVRFRRMTTLA